MKNLSAITPTSGEGTQPDRKAGHAKRYGAALPIAAVVTIGLTVSMAALIATEFTPQDKAETASFEINPRVDDISAPVRSEKPELMKRVETPPPPPRIATDDAAPVDIPVIKVAGKIDVFEMAELDLDTGFIHIDKDPTPLVRVPPIFPDRFSQGDASGYCRVQFDISAEGAPFNVQTTVCTSNQLKSATVKSVQRWKYAPQMRNGQPVSRSGLETVIRFDLQDARGKTLPVPAGY